MSRSWAKGSTTAWRRARARILAANLRDAAPAAAVTGDRR
jgi:hypothetical protein